MGRQVTDYAEPRAKWLDRRASWAVVAAWRVAEEKEPIVEHYAIPFWVVGSELLVARYQNWEEDVSHADIVFEHRKTRLAGLPEEAHELWLLFSCKMPRRAKRPGALPELVEAENETSNSVPLRLKLVCVHTRSLPYSLKVLS